MPCTPAALLQILKTTYMKDIHQISALHPASETIMGYNMEDDCDAQLYTRNACHTVVYVV